MAGVGADAGPAAAVVAADRRGGRYGGRGRQRRLDGRGRRRRSIDAALERFGRLDILINNAGIIRWAGLPEVDADNLAQHLAVHVGGSFNTARAAWPHMVEQGYGRIVMTTSSGVFGLPTNTLLRRRERRRHRADAQPRGRRAPRRASRSTPLPRRR